MPLDALAQMERERARIRRHLPAFGDFALQLVELQIRGAVCWANECFENLPQGKFVAIANAKGGIEGAKVALGDTNLHDGFREHRGRAEKNGAGC